MAEVHSAKIGTRKSVAGNGTKVFRWNNPPGGAVSYWAVPIPASASGPHGTSTGSVAITKVAYTHVRDNYNSDKKYVDVTVHNESASTTEFDMYQMWVTD